MYVNFKVIHFSVFYFIQHHRSLANTSIILLNNKIKVKRQRKSSSAEFQGFFYFAQFDLPFMKFLKTKSASYGKVFILMLILFHFSSLNTLFSCNGKKIIQFSTLLPSKDIFFIIMKFSKEYFRIFFFELHWFVIILLDLE